MVKATAVAGSNIAFIKYWGQIDAELRLPANGSISMTLDAATTTTSVTFDAGFAADALALNGQAVSREATARVSRHLNRLRALAGDNRCAQVVSQNSFPTGAGIASSASGFAALTLAACAALGLSLDEAELSRLARLASGSAARSIRGGFVEWLPGARHEDSCAYQLAPAAHWDLRDIVAIISTEHKDVGSEAGHSLADTSPFFGARLATLHRSLAQCRAAIYERDFAALGEVIEADALSLHAVAMTSRPSLLYWDPGTVAVIQAVRCWREEGVPAYITIDAGPNVHVLTTADAAPDVQARLRALPLVRETLVCAPGPDARVMEVTEGE